MDCDALVERLYAYLDGEIDGLDREEIRAHLEECGGCHEYADFERTVLELIKKKCCEQAPPELLAKLRAALDAEAGSSRA
ncbi:MAG: mycothiol system anti-sigma-R factor [Actinomycetota bacterium]